MPDAPRKMAGPQRRITKTNWRDLIVLSFLHQHGPKNRHAIGARLGLEHVSLEESLRRLHGRRAVAFDPTARQWSPLPTPFQRVEAAIARGAGAAELAEIMMETQPDAPSALR